MPARKTLSRHTDALIALICCALFLCLVYVRFGAPWYDLNDDVLMHDILSGAYTGTPEGHNIQMLYPLSALIALMFRMTRALDWYACFLLATQILSTGLILHSALSFFQTLRAKVLFSCFYLIVPGVLLLPHFVFVQYSVTCALLAAAAAFLVLTREGLRSRVLSLILLWTAYLLRSEMLLFVLPLVLVAVAFRLRRYVTEERSSENGITGWKRYLLYLVVLAAGLIISTLAHRAAYGSAAWREFNRLFDNRTELYDFHEIPDYAENRAFYEEELRLNESEHTLLVNYNYGLDEKIDADLLGRVADYAKGLDAAKNVSKTAWIPDYLYRLRHADVPADWLFPQTDAPYNLLLILLYLLAFCVLLRTGIVWKLLLLFACRSALWGYLLYRGRDPVRITHGLYLVECCVLAGLLLPALQAEIDPLKHKVTLVITGALLALSLLYLSPVARMTDAERARREELNKSYDILFDTLQADDAAVYWIDVFTWVPYTERMFTGRGQDIRRYDIMGGWACKSPLYEKRLAYFSLDTMEDSLLAGEALFVQETDRDTGWLAAYYEDRGKPVTVTEVRRIAERFTVYRIAPRP